MAPRDPGGPGRGRPGFHPPPRATLTWLLPHPSPSIKAVPGRVSHSAHGPLESRLRPPHPKRGRDCGSLTQEGDPGELEPPPRLTWAQLLREEGSEGLSTALVG